jgi:hypothetical protein
MKYVRIRVCGTMSNKDFITWQTHLKTHKAHLTFDAYTNGNGPVLTELLSVSDIDQGVVRRNVWCPGCKSYKPDAKIRLHPTLRGHLDKALRIIRCDTCYGRL